MKRIFLALGSNMGDRCGHLQEAVAQIHRSAAPVTRLSSLYETEPMYEQAQPMFLNMALECQGDILPRTLLKRLQAIEREMGRRRTKPNGPRVIDIDIVFYGLSVIDAPELVVPHPRLAERRFVLEPLAEIAADFRHPALGLSVQELLQKLPAQGVQRSPLTVALPV